MVELRRIDIRTNMLIFSLHIALFTEGHLEYNSRLVCDPSYPKIDHSVFKECDWSEFYRAVKDAIPMNAPEPQGKEIDICMFVDSHHAEDKVSCRSRSCFLIHAN